MTILNIGDIVDLRGVEVQIYAIKFHYSAEGVSAIIDLVDPFIADRWRREAEAKTQQIELLAEGNVNKVINDIAKSIDHP